MVILELLFCHLAVPSAREDVRGARGERWSQAFTPSTFLIAYLNTFSNLPKTGIELCATIGGKKRKNEVENILHVSVPVFSSPISTAPVSPRCWAQKFHVMKRVEILKPLCTCCQSAFETHRNHERHILHDRTIWIIWKQARILELKGRGVKKELLALCLSFF